ncbi:MAG: hypothetical protein ACR2PA_11790 [Hyphomicrobiaceae bacterium]
MKIVSVIAGCVLLFGTAVGPISAQAGKCVKASVSAVMLTSPLAAELAKASLQSSISLQGMKGHGKISVACKYEFVLSSCTASQKACK